MNKKENNLTEDVWNLVRTISKLLQALCRWHFNPVHLVSTQRNDADMHAVIFCISRYYKEIQGENCLHITCINYHDTALIQCQRSWWLHGWFFFTIPRNLPGPSCKNSGLIATLCLLQNNDTITTYSNSSNSAWSKNDNSFCWLTSMVTLQQLRVLHSGASCLIWSLQLLVDC